MNLSEFKENLEEQLSRAQEALHVFERAEEELEMKSSDLAERVRDMIEEEVTSLIGDFMFDCGDLEGIFEVSECSLAEAIEEEVRLQL